MDKIHKEKRQIIDGIVTRVMSSKQVDMVLFKNQLKEEELPPPLFPWGTSAKEVDRKTIRTGDRFSVLLSETQGAFPVPCMWESGGYNMKRSSGLSMILATASGDRPQSVYRVPHSAAKVCRTYAMIPVEKDMVVIHVDVDSKGVIFHYVLKIEWVLGTLEIPVAICEVVEVGEGKETPTLPLCYDDAFRAALERAMELTPHDPAFALAPIYYEKREYTESEVEREGW